MISSLPLFHCVAGHPVIVLGDGEAAEAKRRLVERAGGVVASEDDPLARLAFVALDAPEAAAARLKGRGVLVNVPDRPDLCDFTVPSILDRNPVLIAIGTGGASAGLAKALRLRLEAILPAGLGHLAQGLAKARNAMRARWPDAGERRRALDAALGRGSALDPLDEGSAGRIEAWLAQDDSLAAAELHEICLMSPDPDELTLRQARWLGSADVVYVEPAIAPEIVARARADARRVAIAPGEPVAPSDEVVVVLRHA